MPRKERADKPPLQIVPGHKDGEKRNEQLAVVKQPRASPALFRLLKVLEVERVMHAVKDAAVLKPRISVGVDTVVPARPNSTASPVMMASKRPDARVMFVSKSEPISCVTAAVGAVADR